MNRIGIVPAVEGIGGMASFRLKFEAGLQARGITITHRPDEATEAVLVIGGTRDLPALWRAKRRGVRIVQRLDGINWVHRRRKTGWKHFLRAEYGNAILAWIRANLATHILYQSEFSRRWWEDWYGKPAASHSMVHNGVDLERYRPEGLGGRPDQPYRLLIVEGNLGGGYDMGLENAVQLAGALQDLHHLHIELVVVGNISEGHKHAVQARSRIPISWSGLVPREQIPQIDRSAHLLFSADLNPACPNSVIEALACGLPVVAFDTGALNELITGDAGRLVPYGGDPWKLDPPDIPALAEAATQVLKDETRFRAAARARAEQSFNLDHMVERYLEVLLGR